MVFLLVFFLCLRDSVWEVFETLVNKLRASRSKHSTLQVDLIVIVVTGDQKYLESP